SLHSFPTRRSSDLALSAEGALLWAVSGKVPAHETEHRPAAEVHRGAPPEATDARDLSAELLGQLDEEIERAAGRDEVLDQEHFRPRSQTAMKLHRQAHPPLAPGQPLGAIHDDRT